MDDSRAPSYSPDMPSLLAQTPPAAQRTRYAIQITQLSPDEWLADLAPDSVAKKPGISLRGATAVDALAKLAEFVFT